MQFYLTFSQSCITHRNPSLASIQHLDAAPTMKPNSTQTNSSSLVGGVGEGGRGGFQKKSLDLLPGTVGGSDSL